MLVLSAIAPFENEYGVLRLLFHVYLHLCPDLNPGSSWMFVIGFVLACCCRLIICTVLGLKIMKLKHSLIESWDCADVLYSKKGMKDLQIALPTRHPPSPSFIKKNPPPPSWHKEWAHCLQNTRVRSITEFDRRLKISSSEARIIEVSSFL